MGLIEGFQHDIFISYSHADDLRGMADPGWVGTFAQKLGEGIKDTLRSQIRASGNELDIFWDYKVEQDQPLNGRLRDAVQNSATFMMIMSEHYLASEWCGDEAEWFCKIVQDRSGSLHSLDSSRHSWPLIVAEVGPTNRDDWPNELLRQAPGYRFYNKDRKNRDPRFGYPTIDKNPKEDGGDFWTEFNKMQGALSSKFRRVLERDADLTDREPRTSGSEQGAPARHVTTTPSARSVLLLATDDKEKKSRQLRERLAVAGLRQLELSQSADPSEREATLLSCASAADAIVFLLGSYPGPDEKIKDFKKLFDLASSGNNKDRLCWVWLPDQLTPQSIDEDFEEYRDFVADILGSGEHSPLSLKQTSFADFSDRLIEDLSAAVEPQEGGTAGWVKLYIDADAVDQTLAMKIHEELCFRHLKVDPFLPTEDSDENKRAKRKLRLRQSDGAVLVKRKIDRAAIVSKYKKIQRISTERRRDRKPEICVAVVDASPPPLFTLDNPKLQVIACDEDGPGDEQIDQIVKFISHIAERQ